MLKLLRHIRRQPKNIRDNYAMGIAVSFTAIVFIFWGVAKMDNGFSGFGLPQTDKQTPFATLIKQSKEQFATIKGSFASTSDQTTQTANVNDAVEEPEVGPSNMVLSQEDIEIANQNATTSQSATSTNPGDEPKYREVLIGTTTASTSEEVDSPSKTGPATTTQE